jgi:hypothetical protein
VACCWVLVEVRYREIIIVEVIYEISMGRKRIILRKENNFKNYIQTFENKLSTSVEMKRSWNMLQNLKALRYKYKSVRQSGLLLTVFPNSDKPVPRLTYKNKGLIAGWSNKVTVIGWLWWCYGKNCMNCVIEIQTEHLTPCKMYFA